MCKPKMVANDNVQMSVRLGVMYLLYNGDFINGLDAA